MWDFHGGMMWWGWIFWILIIGLIVWLIISAMNRTKPSEGADSRLKETPGEILDRRYAKGEISKEEYERMKEDLKN